MKRTQSPPPATFPTGRGMAVLAAALLGVGLIAGIVAGSAARHSRERQTSPEEANRSGEHGPAESKKEAAGPVRRGGGPRSDGLPALTRDGIDRQRSLARDLFQRYRAWVPGKPILLPDLSDLSALNLRELLSAVAEEVQPGEKLDLGSIEGRLLDRLLNMDMNSALAGLEEVPVVAPVIAMNFLPNLAKTEPDRVTSWLQRHRDLPWASVAGIQVLGVMAQQDFAGALDEISNLPVDRAAALSHLMSGAGGISDWALLAREIRSMPADTQAPEAVTDEGLPYNPRSLREIFNDRVAGHAIFLPKGELETWLEQVTPDPQDMEPALAALEDSNRPSREWLDQHIGQEARERVLAKWREAAAEGR